MWAATQTVTLSVPGMNCATCPITVKKALTKVSGVSKTEVNLDSREAKVTFDDAKTSVEALKRATQDAGLPSTVVGVPSDCGDLGIDADLSRVRPRQDRDDAYRRLSVVLRVRADAIAVLKPKPGDCCVYCSYGTVTVPADSGAR
ncbi:hypothetical protein MASR1M6_12080 [Rubrivivax sp.]